MGLSFNNATDFGSGFHIKQTTPIDDRFILDSIDNLTDGTLVSPYTGLVVNIKGTGDLYVLTELHLDTGKHIWSKIKGASETDAGINGIQTQLKDIKSELEGKISDGNKKVDDLTSKHNTDIQGVQGQIAQVKKDLLGSDTLEETLDTISEIGTWIKGHQAEYNSIVELQSKGVQGVQSQFTLITDDIKKDVTSLKETSATKTELKSVSDKVDDLTNTVSTNKTELEGKISGAQTRIGNLEKKHNEGIQGVQGQITTLTTKHNSEIKGVQDRISGVEIRHTYGIQGVQGQISTLSSTVSSNKTDLEGKINGAQTRITTLETKHNTDIQGVQGQISTLSSTVSSNKTDLEGKINGAQTRIGTLETKHNTDIQGVQGQTYGVQSRIINLEKKHTDEIKGVQGQISNAKLQISDLEIKYHKSIEYINEQVSQVKSDLLGSDTLEETLDTISEIGTWIKGHQAEYNSIVELQSKGVQGVQSQFTLITDDIKKDVTSLKETSATKTELKSVSDKVDDLTNTVSTNKTELEGKISGAQTKVTNLETKHNNEIKGVQGQISTLSSTISSNKTDLEGKISGAQTRIGNLEKKHNEGIQGVQGQITTLTTKHNSEIKGVQGQISDSEKYDSAAQDNWKTVEVGGVKKDTTKTSFEGKTISEVLDMILFPTLYPSVPTGKPSVTLSLSGSKLYKVGDTIPSTTSFTTTIDRGTLAYNNANGDKYYAGAAGTPSYTINKGSFGGKFEEGTYTVTSSVTFAAGSQPLNNKGTKDGVTMTAYAGGTVKSTQTLYGVYPIYISTTSFTNLTEMTLQNYLVGEIKFTGIVSPNETTSLTDKFTIAIPSYLTLKSACVYNNVSGKYDINFFPTVKSTATYNGIEYTVYKRTGDSSNVKQSDKWEVIVNKKS